MSVYKLLSVLLEYPTEQMLAHSFEIRQRAAASGALDEEQMGWLDKFLSYVGSIDLIELQAEYVQTFDLTPEHSLHLTHHVFGDDKNRGPALVDLTETYRRYGLEVEANELPDYLPLILEFAHQAPEDEAQAFLADAGKILGVLASNLEKASSPWTNLVRIVAALSGYSGPLICPESTDGQPVACVTPCGAEVE